MIFVTPDQRTEAWYAARIGLLTGSCASDLLTKLKSGGEAASRRNLRTRLVLERLTGTSQESAYVSPAMQYGIDREPDALGLYEALTGALVASTGFVRHDTIAAGCSPDGEIDSYTGLLELKCCLPATHLEYLRTKRIPSEYQAQITHNLWITGAQWCDWVSFDDRFPPPLRLLRVRVHQQDVDLIAYELAAVLFLSEVDKECAEVEALADAALAGEAA